MERKYSSLETNIKALEAMGLKVKGFNQGSGTGQSVVKSLKDVDDNKRIIAFYFSNFNTEDSDGDVVMPGSFTKTIKENFERIKHFYNHDITLAVGKIQSIQTDEVGAFAVSKITTTDMGEQAFIEYADKLITEHSMGFKTIKEDFDAKAGVNYIKEVMLWEVSSLSAWGANMHTPPISIEGQEIEKAFKKLERLMKAEGASLEEIKQEFNKMIALKTVKRNIPKATAVDYLKDLQF